MSNPTETLTLADFLLARIAEDEAYWSPAGEGSWASDCQECAALSDVGSGPTVDRMLAEAASKRAIAALHTPESGKIMGSYCVSCGEDDPDVPGKNHVEWPCPTARALAAVYSDHPDYRDEWRA